MVWEGLILEEWLFNGGPDQFIVLHFILLVSCWIGREWEFSYRLGMRPWIFVAFSIPVAGVWYSGVTSPLELLGPSRFQWNNAYCCN